MDHEMRAKHNIQAEINLSIMRGEEEIDLCIKGIGYYDPGRVHGPPDDCYPPEGEIEINIIETDDGPWDDELTDQEYDRAIDLLWQNSKPQNEEI